MQKQFRFSAEELDLLERAKARHGSYKAAVIQALRIAEGANEPSDDELIEMLSSRLRSGALVDC